MEEYLPYVWLAVIVFAIVIESATTELIAIWFVPGALAAFILSFFVENFYIQLAVFTLIAALGLVFARRILKKFLFKKPYEPTNMDRYIGKVATVVESIDNDEGKGAVKIFGEEWSARSTSGAVIPKGEKVVIRSVEGVKLICSLN